MDEKERGELVNWYFEPSQPLRITSRLERGERDWLMNTEIEDRKIETEIEER